MTPDDVKRRLAAIFSADVKEYSRLMRQDETATVRTLTAYREVMATLIKQHHGRVVDSPGDNLLAEFASVVDAVQSAVAIQKEIKARNEQLPDNRQMVFRIGINLGDIIVEADRIYGDGVNIAARLEGMSDPGGVCISRTAYDQIEDKLPFGYEYLGEKTVKNIVKPIRAYRVLLESSETDEKIGKREQTIGAEQPQKVQDRAKEKPFKKIKADKPTGDQSKEEDTKPKARPNAGFSKQLWVFIGVILFLFIINIITWSGMFWFHWPALGGGLLLFLKWVNTGKKYGSKHLGGSKLGFDKHLGTYLGVISFLLIINILTWGGNLWFHWPALGWGLLIFLHWVKKV